MNHFKVLSLGFTGNKQRKQARESWITANSVCPFISVQLHGLSAQSAAAGLVCVCKQDVMAASGGLQSVTNIIDNAPICLTIKRNSDDEI